MWITIMIFKQWFCYSVPYFWWLLYLVSDSFLCFPSVNFRSQTNLPWGSWRGFEFSQLNSLLSWASSRNSHWNSAVKYIDNTMPRQIQKFSAYLGNASTKNCQDPAETFVYHVNNGFGIPQHFAKDYDLVF